MATTVRLCIARTEQWLLSHQSRWWFHLLLFTLAALLTISRRPDMILYPQFWAEDGTVWYEDAYNLGFWKALLIPLAGYFQTVSRLAGGLAQFVPLTYAPLLFNVLALAIKILPIQFLFSSRFSAIVSNVWAKLLLAILYIGLPNTNEVFVNITNIHSYLALLAFMIVVAEPARTKKWKVFDIFFITLSGLSGPFIVFLLPIALFRWWKAPDRRELLPIMVPLIACALIQGGSIALTGLSARSPMTLGATPALLARISAGQVFLGSLIGKEGFARLYNLYLHQNNLLSISLYFGTFLIGTAIVTYTFLKSKLEMKLFIAFAAILFASALFKPMASVKASQWLVMSIPGNATRYWFMPMLAFVVSLVWMLGKKNPLPLRVAALLILFTSLVGMKLEWVYYPWPNRNFKQYAENFSKASPGTMVEIPIMPENWHTMKLIKH